jgi:hypothetical protein
MDSICVNCSPGGVGNTKNSDREKGLTDIGAVVVSDDELAWPME